MTHPGVSKPVGHPQRLIDAILSIPDGPRP
jgi:hypothetical protein